MNLSRCGFGSIICCVSDAWLDETALGRKIDADFLQWLPAGVDPCGENGEFHSFAFAGPIFKQPIQVKVGEKVYRPVGETPPERHHRRLSNVRPTPRQRILVL